MLDEKLPPHDIPAEEAAVAACLVDERCVAALVSMLQPFHFFRERNGWIYEAVLSLWEQGRAINQITVAHELQRRDRLTDVGGIGYLAELVANLPTIVGVEYYAEIVRQTSQQRSLISVAGRLAQQAYENAHTPAHIVAQIQADLNGVLGDQATGWQSTRDLIAAHGAAMEELLANRPGHRRGIPTGLGALDAKLKFGGLRPGKLYLVGGLTSMGKSTFVRWILRNVALQRHTCALLSLEQDRQEVIEELAFATAGIDLKAVEESGQPATEAQQAAYRRALALLAPAPLWVDDEPALTVDRMRMKLEMLRGKHPDLSVVGIDYAQIVRGRSARQETAERIGEVTEAIRDMAKQGGYAVILASQLVKAAGDRNTNDDLRPRLHHFRGSGMAVNVAYAIIGLYREDYVYEERLLPPPPGSVDRNGNYLRTNKLEAILLKQQRGPKGPVPLWFDPTTGMLGDWNDHAHTP